MTKKDLRAFLDRKVDEYNRPAFIPADPISIPHAFHKPQDIEIAGLFAAIFSWGNRTTIINKTKELMRLMDNAPHQFILQHEDKDRARLLTFKHRTFNATDLLYFIEFFRWHYTHHDSLEDAFLRSDDHLSGFYRYFFQLDRSNLAGKDLSGPTGDDLPSAPPRTYKHIASPEKNSSCKRLNMFLRWMVRHDHRGVDFGLWKRIAPSQLVCPLDVHVARVARRFNLMVRTQTDWQSALELTDYLITLDPDDPVKYDFALFGLGVMEKF
ncbi:MAG TPA: TIGR02757 family protein [Puia sp.]|nr:TIGR02757 family protein [Puia sp.]